jgi:hypothetical protein
VNGRDAECALGVINAIGLDFGHGEFGNHLVGTAIRDGAAAAAGAKQEQYRSEQSLSLRVDKKKHPMVVTVHSHRCELLNTVGALALRNHCRF